MYFPSPPSPLFAHRLPWCYHLNQFECKLPWINTYGNYSGMDVQTTYTFCLPEKKCIQCYNNRLHNHILMRTLDAQLAESPWFKRSGGRDHVVVMSHWLHAQDWRKFPPHLKQCSAVVFEDKNVLRLSKSIGRPGQPPARDCQRQRTDFALAKGQPIMLPSLYVNPHTPCPEKNYTAANLTDFIFVGSFASGDTCFTGCMYVCHHTCAQSHCSLISI